jgi:hypothetical protein
MKLTLHTLAAQLIARSAEPQPVLPPRDYEPHCLMSWRESVAGMDETADIDKERSGGKTGWPAGLLQDDCTGLSRWFSSRIDARHVLRMQLEVS